MKYTGTLSVYIPTRNFGFIVDTEFQRIFVHRSQIVSGKPFVGAKVLFEISPIREGQSPSAINVEILPSSTATEEKAGV